MTFRSNMLFDVLRNILTEKSIPMYKQHIKSDNFKDAAKFMILKYLSMSPNSQVRQKVLDNYITLERMPEKALYLWCLKAIPKQNSSFIKFIK